jgi:hypothetical protein
MIPWRTSRSTCSIPPGKERVRQTITRTLLRDNGTDSASGALHVALRHPRHRGVDD